MNVTRARRCLQLLSDAEIDDILVSGPFLADVVRKSGKLRNTRPVDVEAVRMWLKIPSQSNLALGELAARFRKHHAKTHSTHARCKPGVQALIALADNQTDDEFKKALDQIRSSAPAAADTGDRHSIKDAFSQDDLDEAVHLLGLLHG